MSYRETWFNVNHGTTLPGKTGVWYRCVQCHDYFRKSNIDIDHRIPKRNGGTDDLCNLQPMCKHCNRSKQDSCTGQDVLVTVAGSLSSGSLGSVVKGAVKQKALDLLGVKYHRK